MLQQSYRVPHKMLQKTHKVLTNAAAVLQSPHKMLQQSYKVLTKCCSSLTKISQMLQQTYQVLKNAVTVWCSSHHKKFSQNAVIVDAAVTIRSPHKMQSLLMQQSYKVLTAMRSPYKMQSLLTQQSYEVLTKCQPQVPIRSTHCAVWQCLTFKV
jgi:hypothetical protein